MTQRKRSLDAHTSAVYFFKQHAGYCVSPGETQAQGKHRGAQRLARAERLAHAAGCSWQWEREPQVDDLEEWACIMRDAKGTVVGNLGGVDFGPGREPWGEAYRRVVEAELALEWLP